MWPKALSQLIELAPHISRLIPAADRFLNSKTASEEAARNAMQQMAEGLRGDLGQVTAAHSGLYQQLNTHTQLLNTQTQLLEAHSDTLSALEIETRATRSAVEGLEESISRLRALLVFNCIALVAVLALAVVLLFRR